MNLQKLLRMLLVLVVLVVTTTVRAEFRDFSVILNNGDGTLISTEEQAQGTEVNFGVAVAEDGTVSRVAADAADAVAVVSGKYHSEHGLNNFVATFAVNGPVKVGLGMCTYGGDAKLVDANGTTIATFTTADACYKNNAANVVYCYYEGTEATTLTVSGGKYVPYLSVESVAAEEVPTDITVTYLAGDATGVAPKAATVAVGGTFTVPANRGLYLEGKTLTGWSDGTTTYAVGEEVTAGAQNVELTPVFADNAASLADRTEAVTLTYQLGEANGAPSYTWQSSKGVGLLVAQATIGDAVIDVKMGVDATNGKLSNAGRGDQWAQANTGAIMTVPSCQGAVITITAYSNLDATTVEGNALNSGSKTATYTCVGSAETVDIVVGEDTYLSAVEVTLPVMTVTEPEAAFRDIVISNVIDLLTAEEVDAKSNVTFGVAVAEDGTVSRVDATAASSIMTISGAYHSNHGIGNAVVTVDVDGPVKIGIGNCNYGVAKVTDAAGNVVMDMGKAENCYHQDTANNMTFGYYTTEAATTLTFSVQYLTYLSVEVMTAQPEEPVVPAFVDIVIPDVNALLTDEERTDKTNVTFGVAVAEDGTVSRVAADDVTARMTVSGAYHNDHGMGNPTITVAVEGPVKIGVGNCSYGANAVVKDAAGNEVVNITRNDGCYSRDNSKISYGYYTGEATTLSYQVQYCTYLSVEAVTELPEEPEEPAVVAVSFAQGDAEGFVPAAMEVAVGEAFVVPANKSLYVEGKTLTGWSDGTTTYAVGEEVTVGSENMELAPVFADNTVSLDDRTEAVTLTYVLGEGNGAPSFAWEGSKGEGLLVTQATVGDAVIDVKMAVNAANGKLKNQGRGDQWAQINSGTILTVASCKGAVVSLEAYDALNNTTIDGVALNSDSNTPSFTCAGTAATVDVVMGENTYMSKVEVVLPVVESGNKIEERGIIISNFETWPAVPKTEGERSFDINTNFSNETITFTFSENIGLFNTLVDQNESKFPSQPVGYIKSEKKATEIVTSAFNNITRVRYFHGATGSNRGFKLEKKGANDADWVVLSDAAASPHQGAWVECEVNEKNVQLRWSNLAPSQYAYLFNIEVYANVEITAEQVTLEVAASPAEAGTVSVYPFSEQYDVNSEVTLTAVENFGYDFVNWTDGEGNEIATTAECQYVIEGNSVVTANFVAVETYELVVNVEGGANDYMINITPAPTTVEGKLMYEANTEVTLTANNNPILTFSNWASGETASTYVVTMDGNKELTAVYSAVDYLVGWDFIRAGKNSRAADFVSSSDNENAVLVLRNAEGTVTAWLDKSQDAAGGYEGSPAAVNWQQLTDKYYYQTKVNALNYVGIKVQAEMLYNFLAYQVQLLEYSLDGETWNEAGRLTLPAAKAWTPFVVELPAECDNAAELYLRWIPDYTSSVVGSEGNGNDGTAITNIYVLGSTAIYDDGVAPAVVSTIPANNATEVSATGRVVINFDEKVQVAEGAVATLNELSLAPVVSGKVITFNYIGLDYDTQYTFTLPANVVSDMSGNRLAEAVTLQFTTMAPPVVTPGMYDVNVTTAEELLDALEAANGETRYRIFLHDGIYDLGDKCLTPVKSNISLIGESMENTIIVNKAPAEGISVSATLLLTGSNIYMQDLTIKNDYDYVGSTGRAVCIQDKGDKNIFKNVRMLSYQDTYYTNNSKMRAYHENTEIHGTVDFICGGGDVFFNQSTLYLEERASANCITAPNGDTDWGYVFSNCVIDGHEVNNGQYHLGRPWNGTPRCVWLNTTMKVIPAAAGWTSMQVLPELFAEYNSVTENGNVVDLTNRTTTFLVGDESQTASYSPVLTADEAAQYTINNVLAGEDQWQPALLTEQAKAPTLSVVDGLLVWDASDYVFCYAVCCNGKVVEFTNNNYYVIPVDATLEDYFTVRAANEMGGLSVAQEGVNKDNVFSNVQDAIATAEVVNVAIFTIDGRMVSVMQDGINIIRTVYSDGSVTVEKVVYRK